MWWTGLVAFVGSISREGESAFSSPRDRDRDASDAPSSDAASSDADARRVGAERASEPGWLGVAFPVEAARRAFAATFGFPRKSSRRACLKPPAEASAAVA